MYNVFGCDGHLIIFSVLVVLMNETIANHHHHQHSHQQKWFRSEILDGNGLYILDWKIIDKDIVFRVTVNTRGYIGLGFSYKSNKISDSDIILAWIDDRTGEPTVLVSLTFIYFYLNCLPHL